jgi:aconitate hydratase
MEGKNHDSFKSYRQLKVGNQSYGYFSLRHAEGLGNVDLLPLSLKVLLENLLRHEDGRRVSKKDIQALADRAKGQKGNKEVSYFPVRVLMQDFTGVPAVVDLATMRQAMIKAGGDPSKINPLSAVDLVIDHSVMVDHFARADAFQKNVALEFTRNHERYAFLRWGQKAFDNFRVVPPGTGICHQVNLEYLAQVVWVKETPQGPIACPDTLVGTDSHTTMVNGLSVLGWGVGGIEAEAAMLGQPISMLIPDVIGFKLIGQLAEGITATDLVLTVTQMLRAKGVVGKFVEFYGPGLKFLSLADRATIANMAPEYGATCGFFPIDEETLRYLRFTGRAEDRVQLVEAYAKEQGLWREDGTPDPLFTEILELNLSTVEPCLAGPKRPQDRVSLSQVSLSFTKMMEGEGKSSSKRLSVGDGSYDMGHGDVVIAAITSCTNTSNPSVMMGAGLLAKKAIEKGLRVRPWVKTSLAPGSQVVTDYLQQSGLQSSLETLGFHLVGYGCTTCIGNSGPLSEEIAQAVEEGNLAVAAVLSGNRNFEGRINPHVKANYLASPPLVVAYALAGTVQINLATDPLGTDSLGNPVFLKDIWPTTQEIQDIMKSVLTPEMFKERYANVFKGAKEWQQIMIPEGDTYKWEDQSTYVKHPPYFDGFSPTPPPLKSIQGARPLAILGDSVTTDHISPAGSIKKDSPAGKYLSDRGTSSADFNSYGARRGNHEIMVRGTFANIRLKNEMVPTLTGGMTKHMPSGDTMTIYDAAMRYEGEQVPLVVIAGKEYGTGSSRDWAAKGTRLLGVRAVIAESFERIHRSNLVGMGILPLMFKGGVTRTTLGLEGGEIFDFIGFEDQITPQMDVQCRITRPDSTNLTISLTCRIDTLEEVDYYRHGGILPYVLRSLLAS